MPSSSISSIDDRDLVLLYSIHNRLWWEPAQVVCVVLRWSSKVWIQPLCNLRQYYATPRLVHLSQWA